MWFSSRLRPGLSSLMTSRHKDTGACRPGQELYDGPSTNSVIYTTVRRNDRGSLPAATCVSRIWGAYVPLRRLWTKLRPSAREQPVLRHCERDRIAVGVVDHDGVDTVSARRPRLRCPCTITCAWRR